MDEAVFIDANVFLEIFLKDSKAEKCKEFLKTLQADNNLAVTTDFIVYTCIIQIENNSKDTGLMKNFLIFLNSLSNLKILRPSIDDIYAAFEFMDKKGMGFDDSLVVSCMLNNGIKEIASFDKHFDKAKDIKRVEI